MNTVTNYAPLNFPIEFVVQQVASFAPDWSPLDYLELVHPLAHFLHLPRALKAQGDGALGRRINSALPEHQVLETEPAVTRERRDRIGEIVTIGNNIPIYC